MAIAVRTLAAVTETALPTGTVTLLFTDVESSTGLLRALGERLFITPRAVEKHVTSIFGKLNLPATSQDHRRVLAVLTYVRT